MQDKLAVWKSKEIKQFLKRVKEQWGSSWKPEEAFVSNSKGKIFLVTRELDKVDWRTLRISSVGLYIAEDRYGRLRLSIEGSQLIGPTATKNVVSIDEQGARLWLKGYDILVEGDIEGFVIVKSGKDFLGSGAYKEGKVLNHVPKARRIPENA